MQIDDKHRLYLVHDDQDDSWKYGYLGDSYGLQRRAVL